MNHMDLKRITWQSVKWRRAQNIVTKLQRKIFQAALEKNKVKLHKYQERLLESDSAKLLAVRKVTQDNRGRKTAGIDGVILLKPEDRLKLAKEIKLDGKAFPPNRGGSISQSLVRTKNDHWAFQLFETERNRL